jgi:hypothetical protein
VVGIAVLDAQSCSIPHLRSWLKCPRGRTGNEVRGVILKRKTRTETSRGNRRRLGNPLPKTIAKAIKEAEKEEKENRASPYLSSKGASTLQPLPPREIREAGKESDAGAEGVHKRSWHEELLRL